MTATLPDLLDVLGEILLRPGTCDRGMIQALLHSDWLPGPLRGSLSALMACPQDGLEVAYAGCFLHGLHAPTLHLEESVMRTGELRAPGVLAELEAIYATAGLQVREPIQPDHLGAMVSLLGALLRQLRSAEDGERQDLEAAAGHLLRAHLLPLLENLLPRFPGADVPPFYQAAGAALASTLALCGDVLVEAPCPVSPCP
jgi:TorA maturation chaperone TorD